MKIKSTFLLALVICLSALPAFAWNGTGHETVAELAWRNLSTSRRNAISTLLKQHPHYALLLATNVPKNVDTNEWVFLKAATWPDMVRPAMPGHPPKPVSITMYHRPEWHFINEAYLWPADAAHFYVANFPVPQTNILWALTNAMNTLKDSHASAPDKAVSLCWVLHLVGDLHQPLHNVKMISTNYPRGDSGGNALAVAEPGSQPVKFHAYWDDLLGSGESYTFIATIADNIENTPKYVPSKIKTYKNHKTFSSWSQESVADAEAFAYAEGQLPFADWSDYDSHKITATDVPVLTLNYVNAANDTLTFAATRLFKNACVRTDAQTLAGIEAGLAAVLAKVRVKSIVSFHGAMHRVTLTKAKRPQSSGFFRT